LSKLKDKSIETGGKLTESDSLKVLQTAAKQRREAIELYLKGDRDDLVNQEKAELRIIEEYLPSQLNEDEMRKIIAAVIEEIGTASIAEMGKVMGQVMKQIAGRGDGKIAQQLVRELLSS
ncbi:MAG TPA: GatB/YqeY domain-containing protein, partial [Candidatus Marinimicrobia bacterium]|nr:GatB/YqeY domain-containing protein [Candidatus Neomarinimicrobiota bacterium]